MSCRCVIAMWVCHRWKYDSFHGEFAQTSATTVAADEHDAAGGLLVEEVASGLIATGPVEPSTAGDSSSRGLAQLEPLDLAGGGLRQLVQHHDARRVA